MNYIEQMYYTMPPKHAFNMVIDRNLAYGVSPDQSKFEKVKNLVLTDDYLWSMNRGNFLNDIPRGNGINKLSITLSGVFPRIPEDAYIIINEYSNFLSSYKVKTDEDACKDYVRNLKLEIEGSDVYVWPTPWDHVVTDDIKELLIDSDNFSYSTAFMIGSLEDLVWPIKIAHMLTTIALIGPRAEGKKVLAVQMLMAAILEKHFMAHSSMKTMDLTYSEMWTLFIKSEEGNAYIIETNDKTGAFHLNRLSERELDGKDIEDNKGLNVPLSLTNYMTHVLKLRDELVYD